MEITDIRVFPVDEEKLKAFVTIIIDHCFVVSDIKIINGTTGLFISMPSKRKKNGEFKDVAHPLNSETRRMIEEKILAKYEEVLAEGVAPRRTRSPREAAQAPAAPESEPIPADRVTGDRPAADGQPDAGGL